jgi:hypothetical protein
MCCGSKRSELRNSLSQEKISFNQPLPPQRRMETARVATGPGAYSPSAPTTSLGQMPPVRSGAEGAVIAISYLDNSPIRVKGLATGRSYEFSSLDRVREIDARDAPALLSTSFFRRA